MQTNITDTFPADDATTARAELDAVLFGGSTGAAFTPVEDDDSEGDDAEYAAFVRGDHERFTALRAAQHRRRRVRDALSTLLGRDLGGAEITIIIEL